jgi:hypothetical protein
MIERSMQTPYSLEELATDNGSKVVIVVKNNSEEKKKLTIVVTIHGYRIKTENGFRAFTEFFEGNNRIDDLEIIIKNKKFWGLIEYYYHNAIISSLSEEEEEKGEEEQQLLLNDRKIGQYLRPTIKGTHFIGELARTIASRPSSKANRMLDSNFLITLGSLHHGFSVYTTFKDYNHEEITIARTDARIGAHANKYANLTLFNRKLSTVLFHHLHLANVILANRLILKQTSDIITGIEKVVSYIRRRALPFSLVIAAVHATAAAYYTGTASEMVPLSELFSEPEQLGNNLFYLVVLPLIWPITAFFVRIYAPKIFPTIVRYAIKRVLKS